MKLKRFGALCLSLALTLSLTVVPGHALEFSDVPEDFWGGAGYRDIKSMADKGLAKGYEDGTFRPNAKMTAVETLLFCARATGVDAGTQVAIYDNIGKEVSNLLPSANGMNNWASSEMALAIETGVLSLTELEELAQTDPKSIKTDDKGYTTSSRTYLEETMLREDICMYLVRAMQLEPLAKSLSNYSLNYKYKDAAQISTDRLPYVYVLTNYGVVKGKETGNFDPQGAVTRAEMTTMLCRTLDAMEEMGIVTELSEYTDYPWAGGVISTVTQGTDGGVILTLRSDAAETTQSYAIPASAKIYKDNMTTTLSTLKTNQYVRLNLNDRGAVTSVRVGGAVTLYSGSLDDLDLENNTVSLISGGQVHTLTMDRFTQVVVGKTVGGRGLIDPEAGYTAADCYVDANGHLAAVRFSGGTQLQTGLVESVSAGTNGATVLGVYAPNGTIHRYTVPAGVAVTADRALVSSLSTTYVGDYVQLRVFSDSNEAQSVAIDTVSNYVQGPIKKITNIGTGKEFTITNIFTGKDVEYIISANAVITFNGEVKTIDQAEQGWYATVLAPSNKITEIQAFPGSTAIEGVITRIVPGTTTALEVTRASDGAILNYSIDITNQPVINRNDQKASIIQLQSGDKVIVTVRYSKVERIDATPQTANLTGEITGVNRALNATTLTVKLKDGDEVSYTISDTVKVTRGNNTAKVSDLNPGQSVAMLTDGDSVLSIDITTEAPSTSELTGKVLTVDSAYRVKTTSSDGGRSERIKKVMTVQVSNTQGGDDNLVLVDVTDAMLLDISGKELRLSADFPEGSVIRAMGSREGTDGIGFTATIVIKMNESK